MTYGHVWSEDNGDGTITTHFDDEDEYEIKSFDGTTVCSFGSGGGGTRSITVPAPASSYSFTEKKVVARASEPPPGWYPFGFHAGWDQAPHMEFSVDKDDGGMPLWERPAVHTAYGMEHWLDMHYHSAVDLDAGYSFCGCGEHYASGNLNKHKAEAWEKYLSGERV